MSSVLQSLGTVMVMRQLLTGREQFWGPLGGPPSIDAWRSLAYLMLTLIGPKRCLWQVWEGLKMCNALDAACASWQKAVHLPVCVVVSICACSSSRHGVSGFGVLCANALFGRGVLV